jgi:hypothetical protein
MPSYEEELDCWATRCHETYLRAVVDGDLKVQISALSTAIRGLQQRAAQQEESEAVTPLPLDMSQWNEGDKTRLRNYFDRLLANYREVQVMLDVQEGQENTQ